MLVRGQEGGKYHENSQDSVKRQCSRVQSMLMRGAGGGYMLLLVREEEGGYLL